jgi:hypothetical protein
MNVVRHRGIGVMQVGVVDLGTNWTRRLVADVTDGHVGNTDLQDGRAASSASRER